MNYFSFVAPGLLMMIVMMGAMTGIPERSPTEGDRHLRRHPGRPGERDSIIMGKTLAQTVRGFIQGIIVMMIAILVFGVSVQGSLLLTGAVLSWASSASSGWASC